MPTLLSVLCGTLLGLTVVSCADQNFDWEKAKETNPEYSFRKNFELRYGPIDPNQSWDFSGYGNKGTRAGGPQMVVENDYYNIEPATITWMHEKLKANTNNSNLGSPFILTAPSNSFTIVPLYVGDALVNFELHMLVDGKDDYTILRDRTDGMQAKGTARDKVTIDDKIYTIENCGNIGDYITKFKSDYEPYKKLYLTGEGVSDQPRQFAKITISWSTGDYVYLYDLQSHGYWTCSTGIVVSSTYNHTKASAIVLEEAGDGSKYIKMASYKMADEDTKDRYFYTTADRLNEISKSGPYLLYAVNYNESATGHLNSSQVKERSTSKWKFSEATPTAAQSAELAKLKTDLKSGWSNLSTYEMSPKNSIEARSKQYTFSGITPGASLLFYMKVIDTKMFGYINDDAHDANPSDFKFTQGNTSTTYFNRFADKNSWLTSTGTVDDNGNVLTMNQMLSLECAKPSNIAEEKSVMIIGCEDTKIDNRTGTKPVRQGSDFDYEDFVFMIIGNPSIPETGEKDKETDGNSVITKRYMVEDLGTTDDLDFNDVVVDLTQTTPVTHRYHIVEKYTGNTPSYEVKETIIEDLGETTQKATVRAMGGTLDFEFGFMVDGSFNSMFRKGNLKDLNYAVMYNTTEGNVNDNEVYFESPTTLWNPETNNVAFKVYKGVNDKTGTLNLGTTNNPNVIYDNSEGSYTLTFPGNGDTPYIMAFPTTKSWKYERKQICNHWVNGETDERGDHNCGWSVTSE